MTTRDARGGDARGDERGDARRDDRGDARRDDRDAGDTNDELSGEDAKLSAMRSVWLSMRDEEPSSGGLAELMAAARGKAAELAPPPSWWQRAVAGLRRPQVLAFATVLVLLGGALVVGRQVERAGAPVAAGSASASMRPRRDVGVGAGPAAAPTGDGERMLEQTRSEPTPKLAPPQAAPSPPAMDDALAQRAAQATDEDKPHVVASGSLRRPPPVGVATISGGDAAAPPSESPAGAPSAVALSPPGSAPAVVEAAKRERIEPAREPQVAGPSPAAPAADERKPDHGAPAVHTKPPARRAATPLALYRQCEAAATRGDCVEVRRLLDQISTTDRQYRAKAAKASSIAKCLAE